VKRIRSVEQKKSHGHKQKQQNGNRNAVMGAGPGGMGLIGRGTAEMPGSGRGAGGNGMEDERDAGIQTIVTLEGVGVRGGRDKALGGRGGMTLCHMKRAIMIDAAKCLSVMFQNWITTLWC
jgi:hypothetical protein